MFNAISGFSFFFFFSLTLPANTRNGSLLLQSIPYFSIKRVVKSVITMMQGYTMGYKNFAVLTFTRCFFFNRLNLNLKQQQTLAITTVSFSFIVVAFLYQNLN